jgi:TPP-dependent pyruvate/acetoin dehydrogenase alpha subunit
MANGANGNAEANTATVSLPAGISPNDARRMYEGMVLVRVFDDRQQKLQRSGRIGFCVTSNGEEACQIGSAHPLQPEDWVFPYYRQHGLLLYRGATMEDLADHLYGNSRDKSMGRQMPGHYSHKAVNFVSSSSVIGTHLIHAAGAAMAAKYKAKRSGQPPAITVTYIGDGGTSSNDFHSCMTFAGVFKPPLVIFIVNNQYAISLPVSQQCGAQSLADKGLGYGIPSVQVDGNDLFAVFEASQEAYARARAGEGPTLIELLTYRAGPHTSSDDPTRYRGDEAKTWLTADRDPIHRTRAILEKLGYWNQEDETKVWEVARETVNAATVDAAAVEEPTWDSMFEDVYAELPPALSRQKDELLARERGFERQHEGEFPI